MTINLQRHPCNFQQDTSELFETHRPSYDFEKNIAALRITEFVKERNGWTRLDEEYKDRGYSLKGTKQSLKKISLQELACWGNMQEMSELNPI